MVEVFSNFDENYSFWIALSIENKIKSCIFLEEPKLTSLEVTL